MNLAHSNRFWATTIICFVGVLFAMLYAPRVGHGFIKDDFSWIQSSSIRSGKDLQQLLTTAPTGFYRPVVSLTFVADRALCGVSASRCYGLTNFFLAACCAAAIYFLTTALIGSSLAATICAALWLFNWHGISMALLWTSGRTALLVTLFAALAGAAFLRDRVTLAAIASFLAMLSKEEAVFVPVILVVWGLYEGLYRSQSRRSLVTFAVAAVIVESVYLLLRSRSGAFTPQTAPAFYRFTFDLSTVLSNVGQYLDRTATFVTSCCVVWFAAARTRPIGSAALVRVGVLALSWLIGGLVIIVFLPVRSSLYALLPSIGPSLAAAALIAESTNTITIDAARRGLITLATFLLALTPVYYLRTVPLVREADLSSATVVALRDAVSEFGPTARVLLHDDRSARPPLINAFGTFVEDAGHLLASPQMRVWIDPPPNEAAIAGLSSPSQVEVEFALKDGRLIRVASR